MLHVPQVRGSIGSLCSIGKACMGMLADHVALPALPWVNQGPHGQSCAWSVAQQAVPQSRG